MLALASAAFAVPVVEEFGIDNKFGAWKAQFSKAYTTIEDEAAALSAFAANDAIISEHNAKGLSYTLGHNQFSDLTWEQFERVNMGSLYLNRAPKNSERKHLKGIGQPLADSKDWVADGAVTPVKNQARCGSCWAFSTTGSVEGAFQIANKQLLSLSEEDLVQCDHNGDQGCNGGLMDNAFEWIEKNGIALESDYPYTSGSGVTGTCDTAKEGKPAVTISSFRDVPKGDEDALKSAVAQGPVSIAIEADKSAFQLYKGGVLDSSKCGTKLDHGVLVVGYGTDDVSGKEYWKVKNSWGATWGEDGYVRLVQGKNMCGVASQASYPKGATKAGPSPPGPPTPPPPPPSQHPHYEDPKDGCRSDEIEVTISGVTGDFCTPKCGLFKPCPTDTPSGVTAKPQCALQDSGSSDKYCALLCAPSLPIVNQKVADDACGTNASCKPLQAGIGICTYDD
jgi:C1A family cysteine protease